MFPLYLKIIVSIIFSAKWSSSDDIVGGGGSSALNETSLRDGPKIWSPDGGDTGDDKDFKPVKFDSNSLKKTKKSQVGEMDLFVIFSL